MTELLLRDEKIIRALERRAEKNGVSPEEELRLILASHLVVPPDEAVSGLSFKDHLLALPYFGDEDDWLFDRHDPRMKRPELRRPVFGEEEDE